MFSTIVTEIAELALVIVSLYIVIALLGRRYSPLATFVTQRRFFLLWLVVLAVVLVDVTEDMLEGKAGPVDEGLLAVIHIVIPDSLYGFFHAITVSGSAAVLWPAAALVTLGLFASKHRFQAAVVATTQITSGLLIYLSKSAIGRVRPALWEHEAFWGSSFPSGHTLASAAFATACTLCVMSIWPRARRGASMVAVTWVTLVALSRLVLGVHWPTDVLAAACAGALLALGVDAALAALWPGQTAAKDSLPLAALEPRNGQGERGSISPQPMTGGERERASPTAS